MKLDENPLLPDLNPKDPGPFTATLSDILRAQAQAVNALAAGEIGGASNARTSPPTTGRFSNGDFVRNSAIAELGAPGAKYVLEGWLALGGAPGVFLEKRSLTGN